MSSNKQSKYVNKLCNIITVFWSVFLLGLIQAGSAWFQLSHKSLVSGGIALRFQAVLDRKCVGSQQLGQIFVVKVITFHCSQLNCGRLASL